MVIIKLSNANNKTHAARWLSVDNVFTDLMLAARNARLPNTDSSKLYTWWNIKSRLKVRSYKLCSPTKPTGHISTDKLLCLEQKMF